jgi:PAS domain S-box-containing protein
MHRLLKRQLKRYLSQVDVEKEGFGDFINAINQAYKNYDTDYQQLERTLEISSKESFKELSDFKFAISTTLMVVMTDSRGRITFVNDNFLKMSGYTLEELMGKDYRKLNSDFHDTDFHEQMYAIITSGKVWKGEVRDVSKTGICYWTDTTVVPLLNKLGRPYRYISFKIDISKIKDAEMEVRQHAEHLERVNRELDQFAYIVSHDLKAPLRAINNLSEWIEEDIAENVADETRENISLLRGRVKRMEGLIDGILQYSRAGRVKNNNTMVNLRQLVEDIIAATNSKANARFIYPNDLPVIFSERVALEQIFSNFISNAIKYNNTDYPEVEISYQDRDSFWEFSVRDNGPGIPADYHDKIFVLFQTLQARDSIESTGVGLAIVKKLVEDKGGKVWLVSEPGSGSRFYFTWPKEWM